MCYLFIYYFFLSPFVSDIMLVFQTKTHPVKYLSNYSIVIMLKDQNTGPETWLWSSAGTQ